tara:strand:+ start:47 stop:379 length:333 start_codon:yes stop_codon:yes gene_type:complete
LVSVKLSDEATMPYFKITPKIEISKEESHGCSVRWAIVRLSDSNLFFTFEESDREELMALTNRLMEAGCKEAGIETLSHQSLCDALLPKPKAKPKPKTKPKAKKNSKSSA